MAIHTLSRFVGIAICQIFIPAVASLAAEGAAGDEAWARKLALSQAMRELDNMPELVITLSVPYVISGHPFDVLGWLLKDEQFREAWKNYKPEKRIGPFLLYRHK